MFVVNQTSPKIFLGSQIVTQDDLRLTGFDSQNSTVTYAIPLTVDLRKIIESNIEKLRVKVLNDSLDEINNEVSQIVVSVNMPLETSISHLEELKLLNVVSNNRQYVASIQELDFTKFIDNTNIANLENLNDQEAFGENNVVVVEPTNASNQSINNPTVYAVNYDSIFTKGDLTFKTINNTLIDIGEDPAVHLYNTKKIQSVFESFYSGDFTSSSPVAVKKVNEKTYSEVLKSSIRLKALDEKSESQDSLSSVTLSDAVRVYESNQSSRFLRAYFNVNIPMSSLNEGKFNLSFEAIDFLGIIQDAFQVSFDHLSYMDAANYYLPKIKISVENLGNNKDRTRITIRNDGVNPVQLIGFYRTNNEYSSQPLNRFMPVIKGNFNVGPKSEIYIEDNDHNFGQGVTSTNDTKTIGSVNYRFLCKVNDKILANIYSAKRKSSIAEINKNCNLFCFSRDESMNVIISDIPQSVTRIALLKRKIYDGLGTKFEIDFPNYYDRDYNIYRENRNSLTENTITSSSEDSFIYSANLARNFFISDTSNVILTDRSYSNTRHGEKIEYKVRMFYPDGTYFDSLNTCAEIKLGLNDSVSIEMSSNYFQTTNQVLLNARLRLKSQSFLKTVLTGLNINEINVTNNTENNIFSQLTQLIGKVVKVRLERFDMISGEVKELASQFVDFTTGDNQDVEFEDVDIVTGRQYYYKLTTFSKNRSALIQDVVRLLSTYSSNYTQESNSPFPASFFNNFDQYQRSRSRVGNKHISEKKRLTSTITDDFTQIVDGENQINEKLSKDSIVRVNIPSITNLSLKDNNVSQIPTLSGQPMKVKVSFKLALNQNQNINDIDYIVVYTMKGDLKELAGSGHYSTDLPEFCFLHEIKDNFLGLINYYVYAVYLDGSRSEPFKVGDIIVRKVSNAASSQSNVSLPSSIPNEGLQTENDSSNYEMEILT